MSTGLSPKPFDASAPTSPSWWGSWQRMVSPRRWVFVGLIGLAVLGMLAGSRHLGPQTPPGAASSNRSDIVVTRAEVADARDQDTRFPAADAAARRSVTLPDEWSVSRPRLHTPLWYRLTFERPSVGDGDVAALLIERACASALVVLNGQTIHATPPLDGAMAYHCRNPLLIPLATGVLSDRENVLDIRLAGLALASVGSHNRAASLSEVRVGSMSVLQAVAERERLWAIDFPQITSYLCWLLAAVMLMLGRVDRRDSHLTSYGFLLASMGLLSMRLWMPVLPLAPYTVEVLATAVLAVGAMAAIQFFLRYAGWRSRPIDVALVTQSIVLPGSMLLAGVGRTHTLTSAWATLLVTELIVAMGIYLWTMWHRQRRQFVTMLVVCALGVVCLIDLLMLQQDRASNVSESLAHNGLGVALFVVGLRLIQQFGHELQVSEASRLSTELRVREATLEVEKNYSQLAELRVEQVTAQERKRIAGDLHDDLGAKLLTIVHTSDDERISTLAREALEEMRLSVRGLTGKPVNLGDAIGDWRAEFIQRLSQTGLEADWESPDEDQLTQTLTARAYVQTTRILREAVNNIIKHAGASRCTVHVMLDGSDFQLAIQDNGKGIPVAVDTRLDRGHGMASMKHRAKQLQGQCLVESAPGYGTVIRLTLPLDQHVEAV